MHHLFLDLETRSSLDLPQVGTYRYAPSAEILLGAWALDDEPAQCLEADYLAPMYELMAREDVRIVAHNAPFERAVFACDPVAPIVPVRRWYCTMAQALAHGMPGSLDVLGKFLGLSEDRRKIADGKRLVKLFCMPQRGGDFADPADHPEDWQRFIVYCAGDVETMRDCFRRMPTINYPGPGDRELKFWHLDQQINDRGFFVDQQLCRGAIAACKVAKARLDAAVHDLTKGALRSATQRERLQEHLAVEHGVYLENLQSKTVEDAVALGDLSDEALTLLNARRDVSRSSTAKYARVLDAVNEDGRLRGSTQFCGASRTGRSTGRIFQPLNLPRPNKAQALEVPMAVEALRERCAELLYDDIHDKAVYALRGAVQAPPGRRLAVSDWNAIEGRLLSWHADEGWKVRAYANGEDCYVLTYKRSYGLPAEAEVDGDKRQHGKVLDLSMGYEGGVHAVLQMVPNYGVDPKELGEGAWRAAPPEIRERTEWLWKFAKARDATHGLDEATYRKIDCAKLMWRAAHPATVQFWRDLRDAAIQAILAPGKVFRVRRCAFVCRANMLALRLPSGRMILYAAPKLRDEATESEDGYVVRSTNITYLSAYGGRDFAYGGKFANAATQGLARDIMWTAIQRAETAGFDVVLHVYDEIVAEVDADSALDAEHLGELMCAPYPFCPGLPLVSEGFDAVRYRK